MSQTNVLFLILAGGRGSRYFGGHLKQRALIEGQPLLVRSLRPYVDVARGKSGVQIRLVLGCEAESLRAEVAAHPDLEQAPIEFLENPRWSEGMATSLACGLNELDTSVTGVLVGLGDMPWIPSSLIDLMLQRHEQQPESILCPVYQGKRGNPILFPRPLVEEMRQQSGDVGGRGLLAQHPDRIQWLEIEEPGILQDVDLRSDVPSPLPRVVVRGAGDLASGVAHRLKNCGFEVALLELSQPRMLRSRASFAQAVYEPGGVMEIEGVRARLFGQVPCYWGQDAPLVIDPEGRCLATCGATVFVDARMLKQGLPSLESYPPGAFVVGLGPGFKVGQHAQAVIETQRGHDLGKVLWQGAAQADTGVPGTVAGESWRRLLRAPQAGVIRHLKSLGDLVQEGETVAQIFAETGALPVQSLVSGRLRGLMRDGLQVELGEKLGDVDPRPYVEMNTISDKARAVAGGVLEALMSKLYGKGRE